MERYLLVTIYKEEIEVYYELLTKHQYETFLQKESDEEKQKYILQITEGRYITYYDMGLLFQDINLRKINIVDTYVMYWKDYGED